MTNSLRRRDGIIGILIGLIIVCVAIDFIYASIPANVNILRDILGVMEFGVMALAMDLATYRVIKSL